MNRQSAKSIAAAVFLALLVQYPIAFVYIAVPAIMGGASLSELVGILAFYGLWVTIVAMPVIIVFGLPAFFWLRARSFPSLRNMAILGGTIAASLAAAVTWMFFPGSGYSSGETYYGTYRDMIVDGFPTIWGCVSLAEDVLVFAVHGALGAVFFLLGWRKYEVRETVNIGLAVVT